MGSESEDGVKQRPSGEPNTTTNTENDHNKTLVLSMRSLSRHGGARSAADRAVPCTYSVRIKFHAAKLKDFSGTPCKTSGPYLGGESIPTLNFT